MNEQWGKFDLKEIEQSETEQYLNNTCEFLKQFLRLLTGCTKLHAIEQNEFVFN